MSYIVRDNIPILDEHEVRDEHGRVIRKVTEKDLQRICDNNNRRIRETGDYCPVVIGHTRDGAPEHEQPEMVAHAYKFRVGPLFKTGRKTILVAMRFFRDKYHKAKNYPRRSVELWSDRDEIDPISLLGATSPERDLGMMKFAKTGKLIRYSRISPNEEKMNPTEPAPKTGDDDLVQKVLSALMQTDAWKKLEALADEMGAGAGDQPAPEAGADAGLPPEGPAPDADGIAPAGEPDGDEALFGAEPAAGAPPAAPAKEDKPQQYSAAACPSGTNTFVPGAKKKEQPVKMSRDVQAQLEQQAREHEELRAQLHDMKLKFSRATREKDLIELETEGFQFDRKEELDEVQSMSDTDYQKRLQKIRTRYQRSPVGVTKMSRRDDPLASARHVGTVRNKDEVQAIVDYATKRGIEYAQAAVEFDGRKVR